MEQNSSRRWPVREHWDVDSTGGYDDECDGSFKPAIPEIAHEGGVERDMRHQTTERRHTERVQWPESPAFAGRPHWQADDEYAVQSRTRDWLAVPRQYEPRFETVGSAHAGDHRDNGHYKQPEQLASAPRQSTWRSLQHESASERAPMLKREAMKPWPNRARTNWPSREDWPRNTRQARIQAPWRPNTGHPPNSLAGDPRCEGDVYEWANNEAPHSPIESNAPQAPRPRWRESNDQRFHQKHWPESSTAALPSSVRRNRWASTPRSEWQSTRASAVEQDKVVVRPDVVGESRFRNDSNLSAVERQRHERRRLLVKQDSGTRLAALCLPAWAIAPATSRGPAASLPVRQIYAQQFNADGDDDESDDEDCDDHELAGGGASLPVRLRYVQRSDGDNDDDESDDEDCDDHELELESKRQPRVSALGKGKARAKWNATTTAAAGAVVLGGGKRKQVAGQRNNGDAGSSKRRKRYLCRFDGGCDHVVKSNGLCRTHGGGKRCQYAGGCHKATHSYGLCKAHGGGKRCQHAGGCGKSAISQTSYCTAHGGGKRCQHAGGCGKGAISPTSYCTAHGGGKRCQHAGGCGKGAESPTSYCIAHGGGRRCQHAGGCGKGAQSPTSYCIAHGGGSRCQHAGGCGTGAESPTSYCIAHGGGKRCQHAGGCEKSARKPTSFCVAHGGGKRCEHASGCNKLVVRKRLCKQHGKAAGVWD
jgi:hypothetical protein